jgi:hypothetical protein
MGHSTFPDNSPILPRPLGAPIPPLPESTPVVIVPPEPREITPRGIPEKDGITEADRLLTAIVLVARKEQTPSTKGALRNLIAKFSCECGLDF